MNKDVINTACPTTAENKLGDILADLKDKKTVTALTNAQVKELNSMCPGAAACKFGTLVNDIIAGNEVDTTKLAEFQCPAKLAEALQEIVNDNNNDDNNDDDSNDNNDNNNEE